MHVVLDNLGLYGQGFARTAELTLLAAAIALVLGTVIAALRVSPAPPLRAAGLLYVEVIRNTPLTVVFFFAVFVLPQIDIIFSFFTFAVIALSVYTAAFVCEAVRSGINAVGVGQAEAARSIGLTFPQTLRLVVLPQALRTVVPPLGNIFIALIKNSAIASAFGTPELTGIGARLSNAHSDAVIAVLLGIVVAYLVLTIPSGLFFGWLERKVAIVR